MSEAIFVEGLTKKYGEKTVVYLQIMLYFDKKFCTSFAC